MAPEVPVFLLMLAAAAAATPPIDELLTLFQEKSHTDSATLDALARILLENPGLVLSLVVDCQEVCDPPERYREAVALDEALEQRRVPEAQVLTWRQSDRAFDSQAGTWVSGLFIAADW